MTEETSRKKICLEKIQFTSVISISLECFLQISSLWKICRNLIAKMAKMQTCKALVLFDFLSVANVTYKQIQKYLDVI